jgi:hypothetical protein
MSNVEPQQPGDSVALHGRHEADVVCTKARYAVCLDQGKPKLAQLASVGQEDESSLKEMQALGRLAGACRSRSFLCRAFVFGRFGAPVLQGQSGDLHEVVPVARHQGSVVMQHDRRDGQVQLAKVIAS